MNIEYTQFKIHRDGTVRISTEEFLDPLLDPMSLACLDLVCAGRWPEGMDHVPTRVSFLASFDGVAASGDTKDEATYQLEKKIRENNIKY